jgi:group I intron endonuclease
MADPTDSGIYEIVNTINGKRYVGSAKNFAKRWAAHRSKLRIGGHHCGHLQRAWSRYGEAAFSFVVLERCAVALLIEREQAAIDSLRPDYNHAKVAGHRTFLGLKHSPETLAKMAAAHRGNTRTKGKPRNREAVDKTAAAHRGMRRSAETRARISAAAKGRKRAPFSPETRAKLSAAMKARAPNPERVAKMAATKRGSKLTEEHKAAIGAASKAAWERRKAARSD